MSANTFKVGKCPYLKSLSTAKEVEELVREDYTLEYNEDHEVVKVKVGETDIVKEVNSHVHEVGLVNVVKNAIAHGEDPLTKFCKTEPGVPVAINANATLDELLQVSNENAKKYAAIAAELGCSVDELKAAINNGTLDQLVNKPKEESKTEGDVE